MKISLNWVRKYADVSLSNSELVDKIAAQLAEVEDVTDLSERYEGVVVGTIKEATDHPNADKLGVYQVTIGQDQTVQVCAGDKTLEVGDRVAYIPPGKAVPRSIADGEPFVIEKRDLRGEESNGMLGSAAELVLSDSHENVQKLDTDAADGDSFAEAYELNDLIIEVENKALTHRPDGFGMIGIAREISGIQMQPFTSPNWLHEVIDESLAGEELELSVANETPQNCARFTAVAMSDVTVKPSSLLIQSYLSRLGIKVINNVVDMSNYLMIETGQPLHAFDYDKVKALSGGSGAQLVVRQAKEGEKLAVLDGRELSLSSENVVIATDSQAISLAGAIGGSATEVDDDTTNVIIEVGNFDLYNLRRTSMQHGVFTDAVTRFIRGQDPASCAPVSHQAVLMMQETAGANVASDRMDSFDRPRQERRILVTTSRVNQLLGSDLSGQKMKDILENVELETSLQGNELAVIAPTWRPDLQIAEDIIEEIGRLHGYGRLEARLPMRDIAAVGLDELETLKRTLRSKLASAGANEVLTYSFISDATMRAASQDPEQAYRIRNALRPELQRMRVSLLPSLIEHVHANVRRGFDSFGLFEIGKAHNKQHVVDDLPYEHHVLSFAYADKAGSTEHSAYYQAKAYLTDLLEGCSVAFQPLDETLTAHLSMASKVFSESRAAQVLIEGVPVAVIGEFSPRVKRANKLPHFSAGFELDLEVLLAQATNASQYVPLAKFPHSEQDITLETTNVDHATLRNAVESALPTEKNLLSNSEVKDIFQADGSDALRTTFRLRFQHRERTLTTKEVSAFVAAIGAAAADKADATVI